MFNYYFILKLIKRLFKPLIIMFIVLLLSFIILQISSYGYSVDGYEIIDPPERFLNYLYTIDEYDDPNYSYYIYGLNGVFHIITFITPQDFYGFMWYSNGFKFRPNNTINFKSYNINWEGNLINVTYGNYSSSIVWDFGVNNDNTVYFISNFNCYDNDNPSDLVYSPNDLPYITNSSTDITSWSFDVLSIDCGDVPTTANCWLEYEYGGNMFIIQNSNNYKTIINDKLIYNIPKSLITNQIVIRDTETIHFYLNVRIPVGGVSDVYLYDLGSYILSLNNATEINEDSNKELISSIAQSTEQTVGAINNQTQAINNQTDAINEQTDAINEQTDLIKDDTVESSANDLPTTDVNNPTENGIDNIFQNIYNAFCVGQAQDIVFPIPFTNKNITLSPYYVRDMLNNNGASWVYALIQAFWGYLIGRYIISDISKKIDKIKSGNIENVENSNIKEEML